MKRIRLTVVAVLLLLILQVVPCAAADVQYYYDGAWHDYEGNVFNLKVNGEVLNPEMPPVVFSDFSVVPARAVFQDGLGAKVDWNGDTQEVTVTMDKTELVLTIDKTEAFINDRKVTMPIPAKLINGHTMIPARFVGENLGMNVDFDNTTDTVLIDHVATKVVTVKSVSYKEVSDTKSEIVITTDCDDPEYDIFLLTEPTRLVIDVCDGQYKKIPSVIDVGTGNLTKIRFGQQEKSARVVVDLTENLGYRAKQRNGIITVTITVDPTLEPDMEDEIKDSEKDPVKDEPKDESQNNIRDEAKDEEDSIFSQITYGYEGSRDYIKFGELSIGELERDGNLVTIPVSGDLPKEEAETAVTGFFCRKMFYTPGDEEGVGFITLALKTEACEVYEEKGEVRLKSVHKALPRSVMLDAGHGGQDSGAVGYFEDGTIKALEKDFNLDVALRAQELLEAEGVDVHMIRTEDVYVDYLRVGGIANDAETTLFVSIHTNSAIVDTAHGIETYGYLNAGSVSNDMTSKRFSEIILEELIDQTGAHERGVKDGKTLAVINSTQMPATLVEIGFISNEEECELLMTEEYRQKLAQAICDGVLRAFEEMEI